MINLWLLCQSVEANFKVRIHVRSTRAVIWWRNKRNFPHDLFNPSQLINKPQSRNYQSQNIVNNHSERPKCMIKLHTWNNFVSICIHTQACHDLMQFIDVALSPHKWVVEGESVNVLLYKALNLRGMHFWNLLAKFIMKISSKSWFFEIRTFKISI